MDQGQTELPESDGLLKAFIDGSPDSICIRDRERRLILWNDAPFRCAVDARAS